MLPMSKVILLNKMMVRAETSSRQIKGKVHNVFSYSKYMS